ncbi:hypothetical protein ACPA9J_33835 [Pseudomonas aeruginosa]
MKRLSALLCLRLYHRVAPGRPAGLTQSRQHRCQRHLPRQLRPQPGRRRRPVKQSNVRVVAVGLRGPRGVATSASRSATRRQPADRGQRQHLGAMPGGSRHPRASTRA